MPLPVAKDFVLRTATAALATSVGTTGSALLLYQLLLRNHHDMIPFRNNCFTANRNNGLKEGPPWGGMHNEPNGCGKDIYNYISYIRRFHSAINILMKLQNTG